MEDSQENVISNLVSGNILSFFYKNLLKKVDTLHLKNSG